MEHIAIVLARVLIWMPPVPAPAPVVPEGRPEREAAEERKAA